MIYKIEITSEIWSKVMSGETIEVIPGKEGYYIVVLPSSNPFEVNYKYVKITRLKRIINKIKAWKIK